jgi:hypothetical protein
LQPSIRKKFYPNKMSTKQVSKQSTQPVNFYFGNLETSGLIGEVSETSNKTSTNYIILQNDFLHNRVKELEDEVSDLSKQVEELEDDNESLEISKTSLKGYIKNQGEFNRLSKNLVEIYDNSINNISKSKDELEWNLKFFGAAFVMLEIVIILYKIYNLDMYGIVDFMIINGFGFYVITKIYKSYCEIVKIKNIKNTVSVFKIKEDMKEASKGNDYLNDLIDRL